MMESQLNGTKELIFDAAIEMFSTEGYENVSMREIAKRCNIQASSIYNHYPGKQDILDTIYSYYSTNYPTILLSWDELQRVVETGSREEFVSAIFPSFENLPEPLYHRLILITKIIHMRLFNDSAAKDLFRWALGKGYVQKILDHAIKVGRIRVLDSDAYADLIHGYRTYMGVQAFADPYYSVQQLEQELRMKKLFLELVPFLY